MRLFWAFAGNGSKGAVRQPEPRADLIPEHVRANPFGDIDRFKPKTVEPDEGDDQATVKTVAEHPGFQSREARRSASRTADDQAERALSPPR